MPAMESEELQALAIELSEKSSDPLELERVRAIENMIIEHEYSLVVVGSNGKAFFPLLAGTQHNGKYDCSDFMSGLNDALIEALRNYDPKRGATFTTRLRYLLNKKLIDIFNKNIKWENEIVHYMDRDDDDGEPVDIPDDKDYTEILCHRISEFENHLHLAVLITEHKKLEVNLPKTKKACYEWFFTIDTTRYTKEGVFDEADLIGKNDTLFPVMEKVILYELMHGEFNHMRDIIFNPEKDPSILEDHKITGIIVKCYNTTKPTAGKRKKRYYEFVNAVRYRLE
jgi:hypothetical protein